MCADQRNQAELLSHAQLHHRFHAPLMSFFRRRIRVHIDAEDLTQETLLRVIRAQAASRVTHAESYVFTIASNLLRDYFRRSRQFAPSSCIPIDEAAASELEAELVEDLSPERLLLNDDSLSEALRFLNELDEKTRTIFVLFRLENMKQKDIAAALGVAQSTVEKHVMRAVLHLAARQRGSKS